MTWRWSRIRAAAFWSLLGLFAIGFGCRADVLVDVASGLAEAAPGSFATPVFRVRNESLDPVTLSLTFDVPNGWQLLGAQPSLVVAPSSEESVFATVLVPPATRAGDYSVRLDVTSDSEPPERSDATAQVRVAPVNRIEIQAPMGGSLSPGGSTTYEIRVANRGNAQDSLLVDIVSSRDLLSSPRQRALELAPGERATVSVRLEAPIGVEPGQDITTVTARSTLYDGVEDSTILFTTILPPTPDAVGGTLMEILPGRLRLSFGQNVFDGTFDSQMSLSTSGRVLDGSFSSFLSATSPLGPTPVHVTSYSVLYRREPSAAAIGNVSKQLTELTSITCEGGRFELDSRNMDVDVVAGIDDDEARFAGRVALGPDVANLGFAFYEARNGTTRRASASALAESSPLAGWTLSAEGALGVDNGRTSRAFHFSTGIDVEGYFLLGEVFSIGTAFPGTSSDRAGVQLAQRLRLDDLTLALSLAHEQDNVIRDPLRDTVIDDVMAMSIAATPLEEGPRLSATVEVSRSRGEDPWVRNQTDLLLAFELREIAGVFPYLLSGQTDDQLDLVADTHLRTLRFRQGAGLSVDSFRAYLELSQQRVIDVKNDLTLSTSSDATFSFRPKGARHEASLSLRNDQDAFDLTASSFVQLFDGLDVTFDASIEWDRADAEPISFGWGIAFEADLQIPLPFLVTRGQVEGVLFVDTDGDRTVDSGDRPVAGGILSIDGTQVSTDADGFFRFPPQPEGDYRIDVRRTPPDASVPDPVDVQVRSGETRTVIIPLRPVIVLRGSVFEDADKDGTRGAEEPGFESIRVFLQGNHGTVLSATTDATGAYAFFDIPPGHYTASLDRTTLPDRFEGTTPLQQPVTVQVGLDAEFRFGGYIREREVLITFQPPTADFEFDPSRPEAGQPVLFDGSLSFDFDGEVTQYAWDFDGDGEIDATSDTASWAFESAGEFPVRLTVTDDSGSTDSLERQVTVSPAQGGTDPGSIDMPDPEEQSPIPPTADFVFVPERPTAGASVAFDATSSSDPDGEIVDFAWDFDGDGEVDASGPAALRAFSAGGPVIVRLTVIDDAGNRSIVERVLQIEPASPDPISRPASLLPPTADFSFTPGEGVVGEPITFDATLSSDPDGTIVRYAWDFDGDGLTDSTEPMLERSFSTPGDRSVTLIVTDADGETDTVRYAIPIRQEAGTADGSSGFVLPPIADFTFAPTEPVAGEPVEFNALSSFDFDGAILEYAWDFESDGIVDSRETMVFHVFPSQGSYAVRLTVTDNDGATDTVVRTLSIE